MGLNHTEAHNSVFLMQRLQSVFCWPFDSLQPFILSLYYQSFNTCGLSLLCNGFKCLRNFGRKHFQNKSLKAWKRGNSFWSRQRALVLPQLTAPALINQLPQQRTVFQDVREYDYTGASHTSEWQLSKQAHLSTSVNADREERCIFNFNFVTLHPWFNTSANTFLPSLTLNLDYLTNSCHRPLKWLIDFNVSLLFSGK